MKKIIAFFERFEQNLSLYNDIDCKEAIDSNITSLSVFSIVAAVVIFGMFVSSKFQPVISVHQKVYAFWTMASLIVYVLTKFCVLKWRKGIPYLVICSMALYLAYGVALGIYTDPGMQSTTFFVMMLFVPVLFTVNPFVSAFIIFVFDLVFLCMCQIYKTGPVLVADTTDAIAFGVLAIVETHFVLFIKYDRIVQSRKMAKMSIIDQLTGIHNRNSFEQDILTYPRKYKKSIAVIYIDANGLHELNNTKGHKAGDDMLIFVADLMKKNFGVDYSYRVGGDEFVAIVTDYKQETVEVLIKNIEKSVNNADYHIAYGVEYTEEKINDISGLISASEKKMFASKANYYSNEKDRRVRNYH